MKRILFFTSQLLFFTSLFSQDTFSIVAVDSATGEVGSAGATCLQAPNPPLGALIISDVIPGLGAAHTQSLWNEYNQDYLHDLMLLHFTPQQILSEVNISDWDGDSAIRQYGIAMFDTLGRAQSGAFTGVNCYDYKNHNLGSYYSIQGNILLGQEILDSMEAKFLYTQGRLADRLMAAMQGANVPGADTRCLNEGVPSRSSFIRVAKPTDTDTALYLHLVVKSRPNGMSPIDSLQTLFDEWKSNLPSKVQEVDQDAMKIYPNPATDVCRLHFAVPGKREIKIFDALGGTVYQTQAFAGCQLPISNWAKGVYFISVGDSVHKLIVE